MSSPRSTPQAKKRHILLIENDPKILKSASNFLQSHNFEIKSCSNTQEGYENFLNQQYDAVITDFSFKDNTSAELIKKIQDSDRNIPILVTSGAPLIHLCQKINDFFTGSFLRKPFHCDQLLEKIENIIANPFLPPLDIENEFADSSQSFLEAMIN